jgi:hypothetical protein
VNTVQPALAQPALAQQQFCMDRQQLSRYCDSVMARVAVAACVLLSHPAPRHAHDIVIQQAVSNRSAYSNLGHSLL